MNIPELNPVNSSNVESIGYDPENEIVFVKYSTQKVYAYKGVPEFEYQNLLCSASIGSYLHRNYKNVYPCERVM